MTMFNGPYDFIFLLWYNVAELGDMCLICWRNSMVILMVMVIEMVM